MGTENGPNINSGINLQRRIERKLSYREKKIGQLEERAPKLALSITGRERTLVEAADTLAEELFGKLIFNIHSEHIFKNVRGHSRSLTRIMELQDRRDARLTKIKDLKTVNGVFVPSALAMEAWQVIKEEKVQLRADLRAQKRAAREKEKKLQEMVALREQLYSLQHPEIEQEKQAIEKKKKMSGWRRLAVLGSLAAGLATILFITDVSYEDGSALAEENSSPAPTIPVKVDLSPTETEVVKVVHISKANQKKNEYNEKNEDNEKKLRPVATVVPATPTPNRFVPIESGPTIKPPVKATSVPPAAAKVELPPTPVVKPVLQASVDDLPTRGGLLASFNKYRLEHALPEVGLNESLCNFADIRVGEITTEWGHGGFSRQAGRFLKPSGQFKMLGENLAKGIFKRAADIINAWHNSPPHRENLLNPNFNQVCFSTAEIKGEGLGIVQILGFQ